MFVSIPDDVLSIVLSHLDCPSLLRMGCVNRRLRKLSLRNELWERWERSLPDPPLRVSPHFSPSDLSSARSRVLALLSRPPFVPGVHCQEGAELKIYFAGWYGSGKTTFLGRLMEGDAFFKRPLPCCYDNVLVSGTVLGQPVQLQMWDWFVQVWDAAHRLERLGWANTDICLLNFNVGSARLESDLKMLETYWLPGIREVSPKCVFVLHGMQADLRNDGGVHHMTRQEGIGLAERLGVPYFESSAVTGQGVHEVIGAAVLHWMNKKHDENRAMFPGVAPKEKSHCLIH